MFACSYPCNLTTYWNSGHCTRQLTMVRKIVILRFTSPQLRRRINIHIPSTMKVPITTRKSQPAVTREPSISSLISLNLVSKWSSNTRRSLLLVSSISSNLSLLLMVPTATAVQTRRAKPKTCALCADGEHALLWKLTAVVLRMSLWRKHCHCSCKPLLLPWGWQER